MKKFVILGIVSMLALSLTGCNLFQPSAPADVQPSVTDQPQTLEETEFDNNQTITYDENSWKELISDTCTRFSDGCNSCTKADEGIICTLKECSTYEKPVCTEEAEPITYECPTPDKPMICLGLDMSNEPPHPDLRCYGEGQKWVHTNCPDATILE